MKIEKDLNTFNENQFTSLFGSVFEKSEWIAAETFKKNSSTLIPFPGLPENTSNTCVVNLVILLVIYYTNIP